MFHNSNIRLFATAFEYIKLHSKVWSCPHPAIKGRHKLTKFFKIVNYFAIVCKEFHKSAVSQLIFAKQELNFISRLRPELHYEDL